MKRIELTEDWTVRKSGTKKSVPAAVPGCVYTDLLAAREIEDPFFKTQLKDAAWVAASGWIYEKTFVGEDFSAFDRVVLRFDGVSEGAAVDLNGTELGRSLSPFEPLEFDVKALIKPGRNCRLTVTLPPTPAPEPERPELLGLWRGVALTAFSGVRVSELQIRQDFSAGGGVGLAVDVQAERFDPAAHLEVLARICYKGNILHEARDILTDALTTLRLHVRNPQLWWPAGLGDQPLYEVTVDVLQGRTCLEHVSRRIGLRQFIVERGETDGRAAYRFFINRHPFFLKGASWVPADLFVARLTRVEYARLVKAAAVANMNVLRVWGGGVYENDAFYDLCDEYGICVWQDLMRPSAVGGTVPADFRQAARQHLCRLRHHPSVILWSAGDGGEAGGAASDVDPVFADQVRALAPDGACLPAFPHAPFSLGGGEGSQTLPAYPEPRAVDAYVEEEMRNVAHPVCAFHTSPSDGAKRIYEGFLSRFLLPSGFDNTVWLSQVQQGFAVKRQLERAREDANLPGFLFWRLNDLWPACTPSSVDFGGRWKALHYMARRFFSPLWLCGAFDAASGCVDVRCMNDGVRPFKGEVQWRLTQMDGAVVTEGAKKVTLHPAASERSVSVKAGDALKKIGADQLVLWLYLLDEQGSQVSWNFVLFAEPRELKLQAPRMRAEIRAWDDNSFAVTLTSHRPALWVWITLEGMDARYDDNFFCLEPAKPFRVRITPASRMKLEQFRQVIRIGSLRDTWMEKRNLMQVMAAAKRQGKV